MACLAQRSLLHLRGEEGAPATPFELQTICTVLLNVLSGADRDKVCTRAMARG
jgi:hypothetical protein